jgi:uncharacterized protein (TIGR02246 family)
MTHEEAEKLINTYGEAWATRNPDLIETIFTENATYLDPQEPNNIGRAAIREYWISKVVNSQKDITFVVKNIWVDGDTVIAEWEAHFIDIIRGMKIHLEEVAIFTIEGDKFSSLREYYKSTKIAL